MLALDDPRWSSLTHAYGPAPDVPGFLRDLSAAAALSTSRERSWESIWSASCHQGTIGTASYAAVPHLDSLGMDRSVGEQVDHWSFVGATCEAALAMVREKLLGCLARGVSETDAAWLLISLASLDGRRALAHALEGILIDGELTAKCPKCATELSITEADAVREKGNRAEELAHFAKRARSPGHDKLADRILALQGAVSCPECGHRVPLLAEER